MRARPSARFLWWLSWGAPLYLLALVSPDLALVGVAWLACLLLTALRQASSPLADTIVTAERQLAGRFSLGEEGTVRLCVANQSAHLLRLTIRDEVPEPLGASSQLFSLDLEPHGRASIDYTVRPHRRGHHTFGDVVVRAALGNELVHWEFRVPLAQTVSVVPPFRAATDLSWMARIQERSGAPRRGLAGHSSDYESLRPYQPGDDPRRIDWKSSARRGQVISRNLQLERGQQLGILIDCGRMMSRLEHALAAAVRLSYVVQKQGDALSVAAFSNRLEAFLPNLRGAGITARVLDALADVEVRSVESDYWRLTARVLGLLPRRSLVVLFTEVLDADASRGLFNCLRQVAIRHVVLCVVMHERQTEALLAVRPRGSEEAWRMAAACDLWRRRKLALEEMRALGVEVLDCRPDELGPALIRKFLEMRRAG